VAHTLQSRLQGEVKIRVYGGVYSESQTRNSNMVVVFFLNRERKGAQVRLVENREKEEDGTVWVQHIRGESWVPTCRERRIVTRWGMGGGGGRGEYRGGLTCRGLSAKNRKKH